VSDVPTGSTVGVVGAGTMGAGIALVAALAGHPVRLLDVRPGAAGDAVDTLRSRLQHLARRGKIPAAEADGAAARLAAVSGVSDLAGCGAVIEAVVEDLEVKRALLAELVGVLAPSALLATNTSSLSITALAARLPDPGRLVGLHFFNPADRMRLVEVVRGDGTDPGAIEAAVDLARAWGKTPVVCASTPGFIVNRIARPYYGEAQRLVEERVADPATIDAVLREAGGFPLGPFELMDLVGQDVNLAVSRSVWEQTFHDPRYAPTLLQQRLVDAGRLGRKSGRGVYRYDADGRTIDATPSTEPDRPPPPGFTLIQDEEIAPFPVMTALIDRVLAGGVPVTRQRLGDEPPPVLDGVLDPQLATLGGGIILPGGTRIAETRGAAAYSDWLHGDDVVLLDWAHDPARCTRIAVMPGPGVRPEGLAQAVGLLQTAGVAVSVLTDSPGGIVARTVSTIVNEAVDLVGRGEATAEDVDVALLLGSGYPSGPLEWDARPGVDVLAILRELHDHCPTGRYRRSPAFNQVRADRQAARIH
jgi:3-hydroxybutyryl-CoA dehydrogenase